MSLLPKEIEALVKQEIDKLRRESQTLQHQNFTRAPLLKEVSQGGVVLARIAGTTYIYVRVGEQLSRVALTDV